MKIFEGANVPIKSWCNNPEEGALDQARNLARLPFIFKHICLMPDVHQGYGMPIGGVIACENAVIPNAVGVDIGCGMCAVTTSIKAKDITTDILKKILGGSKENKGGIRANIPTGFNHHKKDQKWIGFEEAPDIPIVKQELKSARKQLGTLGGGNHFIEIQKGSDGYIWIMIHSGSRNFGLKIATEYNKKAQELCKMWHSNIPPMKGQDGLAFLPTKTKEANEYIEAMTYALKFAYENRLQMLEQCKKEFSDVIDCGFSKVINIHHNYASIENHFGQNVWVHRKGATSAREGELGIIPGSQGTASYVVKGLGSPESFMSCSHGAGRRMSRKKAREELNLEQEIKMLDSRNILHSIRHKNNLDEASSAYKNIDVVMNEQKDLVEIVTKLEPLAVVKG